MATFQTPTRRLFLAGGFVAAIAAAPAARVLRRTDDQHACAGSPVRHG